MKISKTINISPLDVRYFAETSGDFQAIHLNESFALNTIFKKPIVHGMLLLNKLSGLISDLAQPNNTYVVIKEIKNISFLAPVYPGEDVLIEVELKQLNNDWQAEASFTVYGKLVLTATLTLKIMYIEGSNMKTAQKLAREWFTSKPEQLFEEGYDSGDDGIYAEAEYENGGVYMVLGVAGDTLRIPLETLAYNGLAPTEKRI